MGNRKISVNTGIKIEVNDSGDCIVARVDDQGFLDRFYAVAESLEQMSKELESEEMRKKNTKERLSVQTEKTKIIMSEIDGVFGADTCKKVFGDIVPTGYALADFFDQLIPIFKEYADERQKLIASKYSRSRRGSGK